MIKLFILAKVLSAFVQITEPDSLEWLAGSLQKGESRWVQGSLADSYENQILESIGLKPQGKSPNEYRYAFWELGLKVEHIEIKRDMAVFNGIADLRDWIYTQVGCPVLVEKYLAAMQEKGWFDGGDGKIRFPRRQLIALVKSPN